MGITISLCMIVKDEEADLANCLSSVCDIVDEINIVDTGSTDRTVEIARRFTDRVFHFEWVDDFSAARNFSFSKATQEYIMWLDADDTLTPENAEKLRELKETLSPAVDIVTMLYHCAYGREGKAKYVYMRERLLKRARNYQWEGEIHEHIVTDGQVFESLIAVTHIEKRHTDDASPSGRRNFAILERIIARGTPDWRTLYYYGISLFNMGRHDEALVAFQRLFDTPNEYQMVGLDAYLAVFRIYMAKGEHTRAFNFLADHEHLLFDKSEYYCELGSYYLRTRDTYDKAFICFQQALSCKGYEREGVFIGRNESYYFYVPLYSLGRLLLDLHMREEALIYLEKALTYQPDDEALRAQIEDLR